METTVRFQNISFLCSIYDISDKCEILEIRDLPTGGKEYYVHYMEFNRRLDEWVTPDKFEMGVLEEKEEKPKEKEDKVM